MSHNVTIPYRCIPPPHTVVSKPRLPPLHVSLFLTLKGANLIAFLCIQGVLKMRKRVTLMVITISVIFAVSWSTHSILHILDDVSAYALNPFAIPISHVTLMFNSAVNPFAYALINQRFKEKIKQMISCKQSRVHTVKESQGIEMRNKTTLPKTDPCSGQSGKATSSVNTFTGIQSS